jgi:hypothetical protein
MVEGSAGNLQELVDRAIAAPPVSHLCWAQKLSGLAVEYLAAVETIHAGDSHRVNRSEVWRTLRDEFGVSVTRAAVTRHFRGECRCGKR